jgi:hypothetical protein
MVRDRFAHSLAVATLVVLAGCGGFVGAEPTPRERVTPAPVPTDAEAYPPGISAEGVAASAVTEAHERQLRDTNYTFRSRQRVVGPNGTMWVTNRTRMVANGVSEYTGRIDHRVVEFPLGRFPDPIEYWGNESVYASRRILTDRTEFYGWSRLDDGPREVTSLPLLGRTLGATSVSVVDRPNGVVLVGTTLRDPARLPIPPYLSNPRNVSLTVRVTDSGLVTRWRLAYTATLENRTVRVTRRARLTAVGTTTVERPEWVDVARQRMQARSDD